MSVKRYDLVTIYRGHESWDEMGDAEDGTYVRHDDYAELESKLETALRECRSAGITIDNLEAKCAALAAENAALKQSEKEFNDFCREEFIEWEDDVTETPATDAFLAEVLAQGVEMFAASLKVVGGGEHPYSAVANEFAAQLRKGGNQ